MRKPKGWSVLERIYLAKKAEGTLGASKELLVLREVYGDYCLCCNENISDTIDHVVPKSKKGPNHVDNYQPLCFKCNQNKGTRIIDYRKEDKKEIVRKLLDVQTIADVRPKTKKEKMVDEYMDMPINLKVKPKKRGNLHPYWNVRTKLYEYYTMELTEVPSHLVKPQF